MVAARLSGMGCAKRGEVNGVPPSRAVRQSRPPGEPRPEGFAQYEPVCVVLAGASVANCGLATCDREGESWTAPSLLRRWSRSTAQLRRCRVARSRLGCGAYHTRRRVSGDGEAGALREARGCDPSTRNKEPLTMCAYAVRCPTCVGAPLPRCGAPNIRAHLAQTRPCGVLHHPARSGSR